MEQRSKSIMQSKTAWANIMYALGVWLYRRYGIDLDEETKQLLVVLGLALINLVMRLISTGKVNLMPIKAGKAVLLLALGGLLIVSSGCTSSGQAAASNAYEDYISQQRTFTCLRVEAADGQSISITGIKELEIESPLQHLSAMPQSDNVWAKLIEKGGNVAMAFGGFNLLRAATTRDPTVVMQPEPLVVSPEIVTMP